jgi:DNA-binding beta-propeller fold protein YncE
MPALANIGTELAGYRLEAMIGRGGMGVVYRAHDLALDRDVALKLLVPELAEDVSFRERFLRESRLAASLEHPNVVPIHDAGEVDGQLYIAMRLVEGTDLKAMLRDGPIEPREALDIVEQIADALDAAHARGLVHRDVKPSNVLVTGQGHVYLADFGLTRRLGDAGEALGAANSLGSVDYVAPEQIRGDEVDGRADLYSLGCLLHECLTGEPPFRHGSETKTLFAHLQEPPPGASGLNPRLPVAVDAVIASALAKDPGERPGTCGQLTDAAREALGLQRTTTVRDRKALLVMAVGASIAGAAVVAGILLSQGGGPGTPSTKPTLAPRADSLQRIDPRTNRLTATIGAGHRPGAVAAGDGWVWVGSEEDQSVLRIDPKTNEVTKRVTTGGPTSIAVAGGKLFVANSDQTLWQINPSTLAFSTTPDTGDRGVAAGEGAIWTVGYQGLVQVNRAGDVAQTIDRAGFSPFAVTTGAGAVWVVDDGLSSLWRVDPRTDKVVGRIALGFDPAGVTFGGGRVWVTDNSGDRLAEVDPAVNRVVRSIRVGNGPIGVAFGDGSVWTANYLAGTVSRIDPKRGTVTSASKVGPYPTSIAVGEGGVWVVVQAA